MNYEDVRREARRILGDKAELREVKNVKNEPVPVYRFLIGLMDGKKFVPMEAGQTWSEALVKLKTRMNKVKA